MKNTRVQGQQKVGCGVGVGERDGWEWRDGIQGIFENVMDSEKREL